MAIGLRTSSAWSSDGRHAAVLAAVRAGGRPVDAERTGLISIDSISVRAHQHAAGAPARQPHTGTIELREMRR
jgi:hypothetical protein